MSNLPIFDIAGSALQAQSVRMSTLASNLSNADTIAGGELSKDGTWVQRTTPQDTVRVQINLEYVLGDVTSKGKPARKAPTRTTMPSTTLAM